MASQGRRVAWEISTSSRPALFRIRRLPLARRSFNTARRIFPDALHPEPSQQLTRYLADYLPAECNAPLSTDGGMPPGHHLVYFPSLLPPSALLQDGTDPAHQPEGAGARRLWAGGEVV